MAKYVIEEMLEPTKNGLEEHCSSVIIYICTNTCVDTNIGFKYVKNLKKIFHSFLYFYLKLLKIKFLRE